MSGVEPEAIQKLKQAIASGQHWYIALLEAIGLWTLAEETCNGRRLRYLIANEAFDWLLLVERLCQEVGDLIPEEEMQALLFRGKPPLELSQKEFKALIGSSKYRAYLNYFYGVLVEEALIHAVQAEVRKERQSMGGMSDDPQDEAFMRLYNAPRAELWEEFKKQKKLARRKTVGLQELKEFTYWLFQRRVGLWDKARVASDTKKGLDYLRRMGSGRGHPFSPGATRPPQD